MKEYINKLLYLGSDESNSIDQNYKIRFVNGTAIINFVISFLVFMQAVIILVSGSHINSLLSIIFVAISLLMLGIFTLYFTSKKQINFAMNFIVSVSYILVFYSAVAFQIQAGDFLYFLIIPVGTLYAFGASKKSFYLILLSILLIVIAAVSQYYYGALQPYPEESLNVFLISNFIGVFVIILLIVFYQSYVSNKFKEELQRLSNIDQLTGLANRRHYEDFIVSRWEIAKRVGFPVAVIMCDIDSFKQFNDTYGHPKGDTCIKAVSATIQSLISRKTDLVARYGGEEFIIILNNISVTDAEYLANKICFAVEKLQIPHARSLASSNYVTVSSGIAWHCPSDDIDVFDIVDQADKALYQAKENGRNQVTMIAKGSFKGSLI